MTWTQGLVQQLFDLGFEVWETRLTCSLQYVPCSKCPLIEADSITCNDRSFINNPDLLAIIQTHFPEHLL